MKLAELLSTTTLDQLERLSAEHIRSESPLSFAATCSTLEGILRSFQLIQDTIVRRQPPTFSILCALTETPEHKLDLNELRDTASNQTERLCELVTSGEILSRDSQLRLYRRVLCEARRSDLQIDQSESAVLGVLRRELEIAHVEHFLIEHHADLQEFWRHPDAFHHELSALESVGMIFNRGSAVIVASDMAPQMRQALGIDMPTEATRRLYGALASSELADALVRIDVRASGTREERLERLVLNWVQPRLVLRPMPLEALRDCCRELQAPAYGNKEELIDRVITLYANRADQQDAEDVNPTRVQEHRALDEPRFKLLFRRLRGHELRRILESFSDLRQSGSKQTRADTLWDAHLAETTLLRNLKNRDLEDILIRCSLQLGGSKPERIQRLVDYFASADLAAVTAIVESAEADASEDVTQAVEGGASEAK